MNKLASYRYTSYYKKCKVNDRFILLESKHGEDIAGNIFQMLIVLQSPEYKEYKVFLVITEKIKKRYEELKAIYHLEHVEPVMYLSDAYFRALASAKYLVTDTSFTARYIKKDEQVYLNTWHGTPLKGMGRKVSGSEFSMGNVQRNFLIADALLYQNEFSRDIIQNDYMIKDIYQGEILIQGYPRNSVLYSEEKARQLRKEHGLEDKQVIAYMPTWRGALHRNDYNAQAERIYQYLTEIDQLLQPHQVFFVKLHTYVQESIDYSRFQHIRPFLQQYDTYEFLNVSDMLVTDYSSVMFDYAVSGKKIILFAYDKEEYLSDRGMYLDIENLEFPVVDCVKDLVNEFSGPNSGYPKFQRLYCRYDSKDCAQRIVQDLLGRTFIKKEEKHREQILLCCRNLSDRNILKNVIEDLNRKAEESRQYYLCFRGYQIADHADLFAQLDERIKFIPLQGRADLLLTDYLLKRESTYQRVIKQFLGNVQFDEVIDYAENKKMDKKELGSFLIG